MAIRKDFKEKILSIDWKSIAILALIFLLAFGIRAYLLRYDLLFEFDTYWHTRMTGEIIQHGTVPQVDPLAYYQVGSPVPRGTELFWQISAVFYYLVSLLTTASFAYNKELLIAVVRFLPAFYGSIVAIGLYLVGKEAYGKKAGYLMAFFGAVSSSFIYRSMAGFFEAGTLGYVFIIFGFYFLLRAVKRMENTRSAIGNGAIAAIILGLLSRVYALYVIVAFILVFYWLFTALWFLSKNRKADAIRFSQVALGVTAVFLLITLVGPNPGWFTDTFSSGLTSLTKNNALAPIIAIGAVMAIVAVGFLFVYKKPSTTHAGTEGKNILFIAKLVLLLLIVSITIFSMLTPPQRTGISAISVGEESPGHLYFFHKFGALLIFPFLAILAIPFIDFKKKEVDTASMLFFPFILSALYLAWDRLHYSYNLGVPLAIAVAYIIYHVIGFFRQRARSEKVVVGILIGFFILAGVASATIFTQNNTPTIDLNTGWKEGLEWTRINTPANAKLFNWWDEGHWITFLAERKVITDNRNFDQKANSDVGKFVLTEDFNQAVEILKKYDSDYIVLGSDLFSKRNSMLLYAYYIDNPESFKPSDPRLDAVQSFSIPCSKQETAGGTTYQCGGANIPQDQMQQIPTQWTSQASAIENNRDPIYYYRSTDNAVVYKFSLKQNNTVFAKIWFGESEMTRYFEEVFPVQAQGAINKELKIFKIKKENFPGR